MNGIDVTPLVEELNRVLEGKVSKEKLTEEANRFLNEYHVTAEAAKHAIISKYSAPAAASFTTGNNVSKKVSELKGTEMNVDLTARAVYVDKKEITVKGTPKIIVSGIVGDETGTIPFTIWDGENVELVKGETYVFKNAYTKKWNDRPQLNVGNRGTVEKAENPVDVQERVITVDASDIKIGEIKEGSGNVSVTGRILSVESRDITVKGEPKTVYSGLIADDTGKIQFSAWNDYSLKTGETICVKNAYIRAWRGIPQLNLGDRCEVSRVDDTFGEITEGTTEKSIGEINATGGGLDVTITGKVVDLRAGSGLIKRCPQCKRSVLGEECQTHGHITPVMDLRMKLIIDDGTGAMSAIVNCADTEKLTGITLEAAEGLAKARGDQEVVAREMAGFILMKTVSVCGNVMSDEYGPMMIVRGANIATVDIAAEAENLYKQVEAAL